MKLKVILTVMFVFIFSILIRDAECGYTFLSQWGSLGTGNGEFDGPFGITTDASGNVYVSDRDNNRIQKFNAGGAFLDKWGSSGTGNGQFDRLGGLAADASGNIYVADSNNHRIQKFNPSGIYLTQWGSFGTANGQFDFPCDIAIDTSGNIYVSDYGNDRIQKFSAGGAFLDKWGSSGTGNGQFLAPCGIAVNTAGNVYVTEIGNSRVQRFNSNGDFLGKWGSFGTANSQFFYPVDIETDASDDIYVADAFNHQIQKFNSSGAFLTRWGSYGGFAGGWFNNPTGIAAGPSGNVYVVDNGNNKIQEFEPALYTLTVTVNGSGNVISAPAGIDCTSDPISLTQTCNYLFYGGNTVTLVTTPIHGAEFSSFFIEWSGDCSGSGACMLTMDSDKTVTAGFGALGIPVFALSVPAGQDNYSYLPVENPVENPDQSLCKPFAVGDVSGGTLSLQVGLPPFAGDVDIYLGIFAPAINPEVWIIKSDLSLQPLSDGLETWMSNVNGPVSASLYGNIDVSTLPAGLYYLYIVVTPAGSQASWYLWQTYFVIP